MANAMRSRFVVVSLLISNVFVPSRMSLSQCAWTIKAFCGMSYIASEIDAFRPVASKLGGRGTSLYEYVKEALSRILTCL